MESNEDRVSGMRDQGYDEHSASLASRASISSPNLLHFYSDVEQQPLVPVTNESKTIERQRECKMRLEIELENEKKRLKMLQRELAAIQTPLPADAMQTLTQVIQQLRNHCKQMTQVIDEVGPTYALGETDRAIYASVDVQRLHIHRANSLPMSRNRTPPPPIPAALRSKLNRNVPSQVHQQSIAVLPDLPSPSAQNSEESANLEEANGDNEDDEEAGWICNMCTFRNNCLLTKCEQCDMPFLPTGNRSGTNSVVFMQMQQQQYL